VLDTRSGLGYLEVRTSLETLQRLERLPNPLPADDESRRFATARQVETVSDPEGSLDRRQSYHS